MSRFIIVSGKQLKNNTASTTLQTNSQKRIITDDRKALREASAKKRELREARMAQREQKLGTPQSQLDNLDMTKDPKVINIIEQAKAETNVLARKYNLQEPDNEEALKHDRLHCITCDRRLDSPNAHKEDGDSIFDDEDVRLMCCWCFGNMGEDKIKSTMKTGLEATKEIRLQVYNPIESTKEEIETLTKDRIVYLKYKLKKWEQDVSLVGNIKHDYLHEGDQFENTYRNMAPTRWTSCTL